MEPKRVITGVARGAGHILGAEAREKLAPLKEQLRSGSSEIQSKAGRQMIRWAGKIRSMGSRLEREHEAQAVARRLEETADYLRFRSADAIARDAVHAIRRHHVVPVVAGVAAALIAYKFISSRRE